MNCARMPELRKQEKTVSAEWQSVVDQARDRDVWLKLTETMTDFLARLKETAETMDVVERQRIVRLLVKDVLVGDDTLTIRHSIPIRKTPQDSGKTGPNPEFDPYKTKSYLLCSGRHNAALWRTQPSIRPFGSVHDASVQPFGDQPDHPPVPNTMLQETDQSVPGDRVEERANVGIKDPVDLALLNPDRQGVKRIVRSTTRPETVAEAEELRLEDRHQNLVRQRFLEDFILQAGDAERSLSPIILRDKHPPGWRRPVRSRMHAVVQVGQSVVQPGCVHEPRHAIDAVGRVRP